LCGFATLLGCLTFCLSSLGQTLDTSAYDDYAGHYKRSETIVMTVSRNGDRLMGQTTGQGPLELSPKNRTDYVVKQAAAQITFVVDARGHATGLTMYQGGIEIYAPRIDEKLAAEIEQRTRQRQDALNAHIQSRAPMSGSEAALRRLFTGLLDGNPDYSEMEPRFADATRRQLVQLQAGARNLGPIRSINFLRVTPWGMDAYSVEHEHGSSSAQIMLSSSGVIQSAGLIREAPAASGARKAEQGPYRTTDEIAFGSRNLRIFRPDNLDRMARTDKLPVVVWGNGGCTFDNPYYADVLSTIASHGFVVITTTGLPWDGMGEREATVGDLRSAIDWAGRENARSGSPLSGRMQTERVAVMGQSCGGGLALELGADPRVATIGVFNFGITTDVLKQLHGPVLLINGHKTDFMMEASKATFDAISDLPVFYGALHGVGHMGTVSQPGGGEFAESLRAGPGGS